MYEYRAQVIRVVDGDTIRVDLDMGFGVYLGNQSLRLAGIDAPELRGKEKARGLLAQQALEHVINGKEILVETHKDSKGKYGRWLADIYIHECHVNRWMVDNGFATKWQ